MQNVNQSKEGIDDDEEKVTKKLINKALAEAMLEAKYEKEELEDVEAMDSKVSTCGCRINRTFMGTFNRY